MPRGVAARRYAKAVFQLASEQGRVDAVGHDLAALQTALKDHPNLRDVLLRPLYPAAQRCRVLEALCERLEATDLLRTFGRYLIDQRRLVEFDAIGNEYRRLADEAAGLVHARVRSATPLREEQCERLQSVLSRRIGSRVELDLEVDESLIGGVIAQVGDLVFDGSLRTQLRQLRSTLS
jgi:F-type H+-transporting ATPase subunit delta